MFAKGLVSFSPALYCQNQSYSAVPHCFHLGLEYNGNTIHVVNVTAWARARAYRWMRLWCGYSQTLGRWPLGRCQRWNMLRSCENKIISALWCGLMFHSYRSTGSRSIQSDTACERANISSLYVSVVWGFKTVLLIQVWMTLFNFKIPRSCHEAAV